MAIKQIGIRQQGGGYTYSDIGANSANIDVPNGESTQSLDAALLAINTEIDTNKTNTDAAIATKAATSHADATGTAGKGTAANFGHVKMGAGINTAADGVVAVAYGTAANTACQGNDSRLSDKRTCATSLTAGSVVYDGSVAKTITAATLGAAPTNHASTGTTYGVGDASNYGHVKAGTGISSTSGVLSTSYGTAAGTACQGNDARLSDARTPVSHATSATTYGIGNATNYGHVKVSDAYTTSDGTASQGVSASSYAVNQAYNELDSEITSINNNLAWITIDLATSITPGITYYAGSWIKYNPMTKQLIGDILLLSSINNQTVFLTLPSNVPPSSQTILAGSGSYDSPTVQALVLLNTSRKLRTSYSDTASLSNVEYIINIVL